MSKTSQIQRIVHFLQQHPQKRFTARALAQALISQHPKDYASKRSNPRFDTDAAFLQQIVAEIGSQKDSLAKASPHIFWQDKPRPRHYWFDPSRRRDDAEAIGDSDEEKANDADTDTGNAQKLSEHALYPMLIDYLKTELGLLCLRIDEKRSRNTRGKGGNQWLHPDIVAMQPVDKEWDHLIRHCVKHNAGQSARLWSFEVKKELHLGNARESFFQAVSNSSWAHEAYLVATLISNAATEKELRMLSALHGVGLILLNPENPSESEILLPARARADVDWESAQRLLSENEDFKDFIEQVSSYLQTGRVRTKDWNQ